MHNNLNDPIEHFKFKLWSIWTTMLAALSINYSQIQYIPACEHGMRAHTHTHTYKYHTKKYLNEQFLFSCPTEIVILLIN